MNVDFEPFKAINTSLYLCDNKVSVRSVKFWRRVCLERLYLYVFTHSYFMG